MSRPDSPQPSQQQPMEMPLGEWLRGLAIQRVRGTGSTPRTRPLWMNEFPSIGLGQNLVIELLPSLVLRLRNRTTNDVLMETEPVEFGPLVAQGKPFEQSEVGRARTGRKAKTKTTTAPAETEASQAAPITPTNTEGGAHHPDQHGRRWHMSARPNGHTPQSQESIARRALAIGLGSVVDRIGARERRLARFRIRDLGTSVYAELLLLPSLEMVLRVRDDDSYEVLAQSNPGELNSLDMKAFKDAQLFREWLAIRVDATGPTPAGPEA